MKKTVNFISKILSFEVTFQSDFYIELQAKNKIIGVLSSEGKPNQQSIYLQVRGIDELWREIGSELMKIKTKPPFNQPHSL